jgi:NitT/TauT family transport system substrate-binding protein
MNAIDRRSALALVGGALSLPALGARANAQAAGTVRVAFMTTDAFALAGYAEAAGFFKAADVGVQLVTLPNSGSIASAVAGGALDVGLANPVSLANAIEQGLPFVAIAAGALFSERKPQALLIVPKSSPLQSAKDLEGKTVGLIEIRGITQTAMKSWLLKNGADPSLVHYAEMPFPAMGPAMEQNRIDAAFISEPALVGLRATTRAIGDPYAAIASEWYLNLWFTTKAWLAANPATAHRFVQAIQKSAPWVNAHPGETGAVLQKYVAIPDDVMARVVRSQFAADLQVSRIQPVLDVAARDGAIKRPLDAHDMIATV